MDITEATQEGDAESNMMADRDEDYNTRYGGFRASLLAFERVKPIPRRTAGLDLAGWSRGRRPTPEEVVDHFVHRFLRVEPADKDRAAIVDFLATSSAAQHRSRRRAEALLRELLYLVLSTPEYHWLRPAMRG